MKRPKAALVHTNLPFWNPETRRRVLYEAVSTIMNRKLRLGGDSSCLTPWDSDLPLIGQEKAVCAQDSVMPQMGGRGGADDEHG